jgi:hypothetical protein
LADFDGSGLYLAGGRIWAYLKAAFEASFGWRGWALMSKKNYIRILGLKSQGEQ